MEQIFIQLALILIVAFVVSAIIRAFKQPLIIGYIIAGIIISPFILKLGPSKEIISIFSDLGIALLLFIVGLHLNPKIIKQIGLSAMFIGIAQMALTFAAGFLVSWSLLGFGTIASVYVGIALMFSSTIITMKLLSDKGQLDSLFGKMAIGILIIQDIVAVACLMVISSVSSGGNLGAMALRSLISGAGLIIVLGLFGYLVLPRMTKGVAKSQELLFLFAISWCFVVAALFSFFGFSIEIGALLAGVLLSVSPYATEISSKIRPLRDFFLIIFFIILGLNVQISGIGRVIVNAVILSAIVLILKPLVLMIFMGIAGYTKRNNFLVGTTLAQISEFSLIVLALGVSMGHITSDLVMTLTLTGIITITLSTYMIMYSQKLYSRFAGFLTIFEKRGVRERKQITKKYDAILFGYNRIGFSILRSLKKIHKKYLVVDFNPDVIENLTKLRVPCLYGDSYDTDLLDELPLDKLELAVSTIPDQETNMLLIETIRIVNPNAIIIVMAHQIEEALELYRKGASYVLTPHFLGGEYVAKMIAQDKTKKNDYDEEKQKHIKMLIERLKKGQEHPRVERN